MRVVSGAIIGGATSGSDFRPMGRFQIAMSFLREMRNFRDRREDTSREGERKKKKMKVGEERKR